MRAIGTTPIAPVFIACGFGKSGQEIEVTVSATVDNLSGMTPGQLVYLSDTAGQYSGTAGTNQFTVGKALTAAAMLINVSEYGAVDPGDISLPVNQVLIGQATGLAASKVLAGDVTVVAAGTTSITADSIVNADVKTTAAIDNAKLAWTTNPDFNGKLLNNVGEIRGQVAYGGLYVNGSVSGVSGIPIFLRTTGAGAGFALTTRLTISADLATAVATWANVTHTGITLSGSLDANSQTVIKVSSLTVGAGQVGSFSESGGEPYVQSTATSQLHLVSKHTAGTMYIDSERANATNGTALLFRTFNAADAITNRLAITGGVATAVATWSNITHTGLSLSGNIAAGGNSITGANQLTSTTSTDSGSAADTVTLGGYDLGAGQRTLAIGTEEAVAVEGAPLTNDRSLQVRINGVTYKIMLKA
jgi:hypothetical protein